MTALLQDRLRQPPSKRADRPTTGDTEMKKTALMGAAFTASLFAAAGSLAAQDTIKIGAIPQLLPFCGLNMG